MTRSTNVALGVLLSIAATAPVRGDVLDFDSYTDPIVGITGEAFSPFIFPDGSQWRAVNSDFFHSDPFFNNTNISAPSGNFMLMSVAFNGLHPAGFAELTSTGPVDFFGAFFMSLPKNNAFEPGISASELTVQGFLDDTLVGEYTFPLGIDGFQFVPMEIVGINRLVMIADQGFWLLDDFTFQASGGNAEVPEPASVAIWAGLAGALVVAGYRRRMPPPAIA